MTEYGEAFAKWFQEWWIKVDGDHRENDPALHEEFDKALAEFSRFHQDKTDQPKP